MREEHQRQVRAIAGTMVAVSDPAGACPVCCRHMGVQKTLTRWGVTLEHGRFRIYETVHVCTSGCRHAGRPVTRRPSSLAELLPPRSVIGYDVMVHVGVGRFVHHRQRAEISAVLETDYGIALSSGEISELGRRFLIYLETLHRTSAPALRAALEADGGWPLHVDATGEDGRGTLLVAFAGWRRWVLGAWKIPTERADAILPKLQDVTSLFGAPCAIMRDLGRAVTEAAQGLVDALDISIPILACHYHFLADIGKDLLGEAHDRLRELFRQTGVRTQLRALARDLGRSVGKNVEQAREAVRLWQRQGNADPRIPSGIAGIAIVRALAQWPLDFSADGSDEGFPFDLPYEDLYDRCLQICRATDTFLRNPPDDGRVKRALERLQRILRPIACDIPPFVPMATSLKRRAVLFQELRKALRLIPESVGEQRMPPRPNNASRRFDELSDIRTAVDKLAASLRQRRPERGPASDARRAIDIVLSHLDTHGRFLWGHAIEIHRESGTTLRLVDRTNDELEGFFHCMKHGERRRSGRKILTQDFEQLPPAAALAKNLTYPDYVEIVCGTLDCLPRAFAQLDQENRRRSLAATSARPASIPDIECASLNSADRRLVRTEGMDQRIMTAALSGYRRLATA
jgi:hypothetical protein